MVGDALTLSKIGIITFHSAYNYGSVLQAFATQTFIKKLGSENEIINYRLDEQRRVYSNLRFNYGYKELIKDLSLLPIYGRRNIRKEKFETFLFENIDTSDICRTPEDVRKIWDKYPTIISGSDQIWNKHSLELEHIGWNFMDPYLLKGYHGKKISYASSIANMNDWEIKRILPEINDFALLSMREETSAKKVSNYLKRDVISVLDPTFLLTKEEWIQTLHLNRDNKKFILFYSLHGITKFNKIKNTLIELSKARNCKILTITPFCYIKKSKYFEPHPEFGPHEFIESVYNSNTVITDSFHGTILSINFGKDVYSLCDKNGSEFRKIDVLKQLGMNERIIFNASNLIRENFQELDYKKIYSVLEDMRNKSILYLKKALED